MRVNAFVLTGLLALSTAAPIAAAAAPIALEWVPEAFHQFDLTTKDGRLIGGITTGGDPQLVVRTPRGVEVPPTHTVLAFEYFASAGVDVLQVFTAGPEAPYGWTPKRMVELTRMPESEAFVPQAIPVADLSEGNWSPAPSAFRIDPGNRAGVALQIRNPVLRPPTPAEQMGAEAREAARRGMEAASATIEAFLAAAPAALLEARLDGDGGIVISGTLPEGVASARLHALEPHELVTTALAAGLPAEGALTVVNRPASRSCWQRLWAPQAVEDAPQRFEFARPRFGGEGRDHLADRYLLVDAATGAALGAPVWVTDTSAARERAIPRLYPTNKKGLGGVIYHPVLLREDAPKLGVTASTVNMKLDELFAPGPERIAFTHQGREWSFSRDIVDRWDRTIRAWTELGVVVSGILLIADGEHPLVHPSYDPAGIFSIANLTTREGADAFRAAMAFVAERYTRSEREHGWITHWIVFNEVDYGWIWTNMGDVLLPEYLETYHRALRLVWLEASLFQESTEVFISLTHNWDYDSGRPTRR